MKASLAAFLLSIVCIHGDEAPVIRAKADLEDGKPPKEITLGPTETLTLRLINDTEQPRILFALSGSVTDGTKLTMEFVQLSKPSSPQDNSLEMWHQRNLVFRSEKPASPLVATLNPGEEALLTVLLSKLSDPEDPGSKRVPLPKGAYRLRIPFASGEEFAETAASGSGLPPAVEIKISRAD